MKTKEQQIEQQLIRQGKKVPSVSYDLLNIEKTLNAGLLGVGSFKSCYKAQWTGMHTRLVYTQERYTHKIPLT